MSVQDRVLETTIPSPGDQPKKHYIAGKWREAASGETFWTTNPSTGEKLAEFAAGGREDVDAAVRAARRAFEGEWSRYSAARRQRVLTKLGDLVAEHYEELRLLDVLEMGLPIGNDPRDGMDGIVGVFYHYAGLATSIQGETVDPSTAGEYHAYTRKEPVGVVGAIIPWNAPLITAVWKIAPVLATGCTMVLKPSEQACLSPVRLGELIETLDLPDGVFNIVTGDGTAGAALSEHPGVDKIAFTGSSATGQAIVRAAAGNLKRVSLNSGVSLPMWSSLTPRLTRPSSGRPWGSSGIPARHVVRVRGCSSSVRYMTGSSTASAQSRKV